MRIFKTRAFQRWLNKQSLTDNALFEAVREIEQGLAHANLGGFLYKQRVAVPGRGKRGSVRTLVAVKHRDKAFFLYGFAKNQRDTLTSKEELAYKLIAKSVLGFTDTELADRLYEKTLIEVIYDPET